MKNQYCMYLKMKSIVRVFITSHQYQSKKNKNTVVIVPEILSSYKIENVIRKILC